MGAEISSRLLAGLAPGSGGRAEKLALEGGEDYALIFALPPGARLPAELEWTRVGSFSEKPGELVLCEGDSRRLYSAKGYDHFA